MPMFTVSSTDIQVHSAFCNKESVQKGVRASVSQKATLCCEVSDSKMEVKWYKDGKPLTTSSTVHTETKGRSRQLVIDSVEKKDAGVYTCEAGTERLDFKIHVEGKENIACYTACNYHILNCAYVCVMLAIVEK